MEPVDNLKVALVVLNYKRLGDTLEFLSSASHLKTKGFILETIVVDNGSEDGSQEALSKLKNIQFLETNENLGFSGGMNVGIRHALKRGATYIIIINNDTICDQDLIINLMKGTKKFDIISPKIYFAKGYEFHKDRYKQGQLGKVVWYAGGKIDWENVIGIHLGVDDVDNGQFSKSHQIDFATGCCMLISKTVFEKNGFLDEDYFLYLEDLDFCVRAKKTGFKIGFEPDAILWHRNASSIGGSGSTLQNYYIFRNRLIFASKYASFKTKLALVKHILSKANDRTIRKALLDFILHKYGRKK